MLDISFKPLAVVTSVDPGNTTGIPVIQEKPEAVDFSSVLERAISQRSTPDTVATADSSGRGGLPISATHTRHLLSSKEGGSDKEDFQQKMLGIRAYRQQIIASNIANADTPGYKAVDIDIKNVANLNQAKPLSMATTSLGHINGNAIEQSLPLNIKYHTPFQANADGNTVEMDIERQKFAENSLMYQFSLDRVSGEFKHMTELFQSLK